MGMWVGKSTKLIDQLQDIIDAEFAEIEPTHEQVLRAIEQQDTPTKPPSALPSWQDAKDDPERN